MVGAYYVYGITYRTLKDNDPGNITPYPYSSMDQSKLTKSYFDSIESKSKGYAQGWSLGYRAGRLTLTAAIEQSKHEWKTSMASGLFDSVGEPSFIVPTAMSYYSTDSLGGYYAPEYQMSLTTQNIQVEDTVMMVHSFKHLTIPLTLSYSFTRPCSKVGVAVTGGIAASFLKSYTLTQDGTRKAPEEHYVRTRNYQLVAGASVSYSPVRWLSVELQPTYRRFIQPVNRLQSVQTYPYMLGAQGVLYFRF